MELSAQLRYYGRVGLASAGLPFLAVLPRRAPQLRARLHLVLCCVAELLVLLRYYGRVGLASAGLPFLAVLPRRAPQLRARLHLVLCCVAWSYVSP